jgi:hypothetical protein
MTKESHSTIQNVDGPMQEARGWVTVAPFTMIYERVRTLKIY